MLAMADQTAGPNGLNIFVGNFHIFFIKSKTIQIYIYLCFSTRFTSARKEKSSDKIFLTPCN